MRLQVSGSIVCAVVLLLSGMTALSAQEDPAQLEKTAIERISRIQQAAMNAQVMPEGAVAELALAEQELERSHSLYMATGDTANGIWTISKLSEAQRLQDRWEDARQTLHRALDLAHRENHRAYQSMALVELARLENLGFNNFGPAYDYLRAAIRIAETLPSKFLLAHALDQKADFEGRIEDRFAKADTATRVIEIARELKDQDLEFRGYRASSDAWFQLTVRCGRDLRESYKDCLGMAERAELATKEAARLARNLGLDGVADHYNQKLPEWLAKMRQMMRRREEDVAQLRQFRKPYLYPTQPADVMIFDKFQGKPSDRVDDLKPPLFVRPDARYTFLQAANLASEGRADQALEGYLHSVELLEHERRSLQDDSSRASFLEERLSIYETVIDALLDAHRYDKAFEMLERFRSRSIVELLQSRSLQLSASKESKDHTLYAELAKLRADIQFQRNKLIAGNAPDPGATIAHIRKLESDQDLLLSRIEREAPALRDLVIAQPVSLDTVLDALRSDGSEMLYYLVKDVTVVALHIGPGGVHAKNVVLPYPFLAQKVQQLLASMADGRGTFDRTVARELYLFLIQPLLEFVGSRSLVIVPHRDLTRIPFQALLSPSEEFFGDRFAIAYAPSASVMTTLKRVPELKSADLFAVADRSPTFVAEVRAVAKQYPNRARVVRGAILRKSTLAKSMDGAGIVHLAVHGAFKPGDPLLSELILNRDTPDAESLTAAEMFGLPLDRTRFVALSACETGVSETRPGNELVGMERALFYAGAQALLLSLWEVNSAATAAWMQSFYRAAQTSPPAEAARRASLALRKDPRYAHPFYWAAFTIRGR